MIDETRHCQIVLAALRKEYPEAPEEEIKKTAQLEIDVLYCYQTLAFENGEYKYKDLNWCRTQLRTYDRIDSSATDTDIKKALDGNVKRKRLYSNYFSDSGVEKYKYNISYTQPKPNPFESDEYKKITSGIC